MRYSDQTDKLDAKMCKARLEMKHAILNRTNPHFRSQYADLTSVLDAIMPSAGKHDLSVMQGEDWVDGILMLTTRVATEGQWVESRCPIRGETPQARASDATYNRRRHLSEMFAIASEDDDDGDEAEASATPKMSAAKSRPLYEELEKEMRQIKTTYGLKVWAEANRERIHSMKGDWLPHFREEYARLMRLAVAADEASPVKRQLQDSLAEEGEPD